MKRAVQLVIALLLLTSPAYAARIDGGGGGGSGQTVNADIASIGATTATNPSAEANLKSLTLPAGSLNQTGRVIKVHASGRYTTNVGQTPTARFRLKLCTVSGCGSGTVLTLADFTTAATTASTTNSWQLEGIIGTNATGATGTVFSKWMLDTKLGAAGDLTPEERLDQNNAASSAIDLTGALYVQVTILLSTADAGNSVTQHIGYVDGGWLAACSIDSSGLLSCPGGIQVGTGSGPGRIEMLEGTAPGAHATANWHNVYIDSTTSRLASHENGGTARDYVNNPIARRIWLPAAGCNNATAASIWDLPTSSPAVAACVTGTNTQKGVLDFADGSNLSAQVTWKLPSTWTGNIDANIKWLSTAIAGDVVWQLATICVADAETDDPAFNTASTVTDTTKGTTNQTNDAALTSITVTGCAAGELLHVKVFRDSAHASDTMAGTARLIGVELVIRETL